MQPKINPKMVVIQKFCFSFVILTVFIISVCHGHGRLIDPPGRASAWRYGLNTPVNYDDNQMFCGGREVQWNQFNGKCGICGDPYGGPRQHEAGGRYATGTIVKSYTPGQVIQVTVELTANHKGWFEFRLCRNNNPNRRVTQRCLDRGLLPLASGSGTRFPVSSDMRVVPVGLRLPSDLTCTQCVLQWKYNAGNSWGVDPATGKGCTGCGPQEQFYGCADIAIGSQHHRPNNNRPSVGIDRDHSETDHSHNGHRRHWPHAGSGSRREEQDPNRRLIPGRNQPGRPQRPNNGGENRGILGTCKALPVWSSSPGMDDWCQNNCSRGYCPSSHCTC